MLKENYVKVFEESIIKNWSKPALYDYVSKRTLTYCEMAVEIARLQLFFKNAGIQPGDKIALIGRNSSYWATLYMATTLYGAVIVPILDEFNPVDMLHILRHSDSRLLFCDAELYYNIDPQSFSSELLPLLLGAVSLVDNKLLYAAKGSNLAHLLADFEEAFSRKYPSGYKISYMRYARVDNGDLAMISYTSGTTSLTKGVMLSYNNLLGNVLFGVRNYRDLGVKLERSLAVLPLAHTYGLAFSLLVQLASGAQVTFLGKIPSPKIVIDACRQVRPNLLFFVPLVMEKIYSMRIVPILNKIPVAIALKIPGINRLIYRLIGRKVYQSLGGVVEDIIVGGAALNPEVEAFFYKCKLPFLVGYGMTECAPLISYIHHSKFVPTSVGKELKGLMRVKVLKEKNNDKIGEIVVKGENVMMGYYKDPAATVATFTKDGWLKTGDLGCIDNQGNIYIKGRSKTMLLGPSGENIYPEAIESKLANTSYIQECIVIQNAMMRLEAWVYPNYDAIRAAGYTEEDLPQLMEKCREKTNQEVAKYENIAMIRVSSEPFPKTPKHTIKRYYAEKFIKENDEGIAV